MTNSTMNTKNNLKALYKFQEFQQYLVFKLGHSNIRTMIQVIFNHK